MVARVFDWAGYSVADGQAGEDVCISCFALLMLSVATVVFLCRDLLHSRLVIFLSCCFSLSCTGSLAEVYLTNCMERRSLWP